MDTFKRRYGVPADLIARATERRLAGDWRGACAAAGIDVDLDLGAIAGAHGPALAAAVEDDLVHLVPDLLRWHALRFRQHPALTSAPIDLPLRMHRGHALALFVPEPLDRGLRPQRLGLRFGRIAPAQRAMSLHASRELWDVRHTGELLARCGGRTRLPFFTATGDRLPEPALRGDRLPETALGGDRLPEPALRGDPEALTERIVRLYDQGRMLEAWDAAGFELDLHWSADERGRDRGRHGNTWHRRAVYSALATASPGLGVLAGQARKVLELAAPTRRSTVLVPLNDPADALLLDRLDRDRPRVRVIPGGGRDRSRTVVLPLAARDWPEDFWDLVRGRIAPGHLHPLVGAALFPALPAPSGPPPPGLPDAFRVRCSGTWHRVTMRDGRVDVPHPPADLRRELTLRALGGAPLAGCAAAFQGWRENGHRLPRPLREARADLLRRVYHGEAGPLETLLEAGLDPHVRDGRDRTLLHLLPWLFPVPARMPLLHRLLAAGLDVGARDALGHTPLHAAVRHGGSVEHVRALLAAGADRHRHMDRVATAGLVPADRPDLAFLREL